MNSAEIRTEAIERIARADYTAWRQRVLGISDRWDEECEHLPWDEASDQGEWGRDHWRRIHTPSVDAVADLLRPPPRVIATVAELDELPPDSVVLALSLIPRAFAKAFHGFWWCAGPIRAQITSEEVLDGVTAIVLWAPEVQS